MHTQGRFTRYEFVANDKLTTGLRHDLGQLTRARHFHHKTFKNACNSTPEKYSLCRQLNSTSSSLQREINFSVSSSKKVVFAFVDGDLPELVATTTSSAILKHQNFAFLPYSVEICHKIRQFLSISATIVAAF